MTKAREVSGTPEVVLSSGSFTNVASVALNNFLTDTYRFYNFRVYASGTAGFVVSLQFRENTTTKTTGYYGGQLGVTNGGSIANRNSVANGAALYLGNTNNTGVLMSSVEIIRPSTIAGAMVNKTYDDNLGGSTFGSVSNYLMSNFNGLLLSCGTNITGYYILSGIRV